MKKSPSHLPVLRARLPRRAGKAFARRAPNERRRAILDAARAALATRDYHAVTMDDVARAAGVAKGSVYLYFPTKERLFEAMVGAMEVS